MLFAATAAVATLGLSAASHAQLSVTGNNPVLIDFDSTVAGVSNGAYAANGFTPGATTAGQLDSNSWAVTGWSNGNLSFGGTQATANTDYTRGPHANIPLPTTSPGGMYAFSGGNITTGVALGIQPGGSDWAPGTLTLRVQNNTAQTLKGLDLGYIAYIRNDQARSNSFNLSASTDNTNYALVTGTNTQLTSGVAADTNGFVANAASAGLSGISVAPGSFLYLRWNGADVGGSGSRDEFALDNIALNNFVFGSEAKNLVWNSFPTGTWNTTAGNTPWLEGATPSSFTDGDNVTFNEPSSNATVTVASVSPSAITINNATNSYTFTGGSINGGTTLTKTGAGTVIFAANNTFNGGTIVSDNGATIITQAATALGTGSLRINGQTTLQTDSDLTVAGGIVGTNALTKTGAGKLTVGGSNSAASGGSIQVNTGVLEMTSVGSLGGLGTSSTPAMAITLNPGTELLTNFGSSSFRAGASIVVNSATITRPNGAPDGDNAFDFYFGATEHGTLTVNGNSKIQSLDLATGTGDGAASVAGNSLGIRGRVIVSSGATLTVHNANNLGDYGSNAVSFRGVTDNSAPGTANDGFYVESGATVVMTGPGEKRFGAGTTGKPIIGRGTSAAESTLKLDSRTFLGDIAANETRSISRLVVAGTGTGGLRIEAPMNATYAPLVEPPPVHPQPAEGTTGLFGINTTQTQDGGTPPAGYFPIGNAYTVLSPKRLNQLSAPFGTPAETLGGTLTIAATDATDATGLIDNGPDAPTPIKLAVDNAATSAGADLVYQINPAANGAKFGNFGGLAVKKSNPGVGTVTAQLLGNAKIADVAVSGGARLDMKTHKLVTQSPLGSATQQGETRTYSGIAGLIQSGFVNGQGDWSGPGIVTTAEAAQGGLTTLGSAIAGEVLPFESNTILWGGQTVSMTDTIVMYTHTGDANLDGNVDGGDYAFIDAYVGSSAADAAYYKGDFNYDGFIDGGDYAYIDVTVGSPTMPASGGAGAGLTAVPEPASLSVIALGAAALLGRRRRTAK